MPPKKKPTQKDAGISSSGESSDDNASDSDEEEIVNVKQTTDFNAAGKDKDEDAGAGGAE